MLKKAVGFLFIPFLMCITVAHPFSFGDGLVRASQGSSPISSLQTASVKGIRYWSNAAYTRIVIDLDGEVTYQDHLLREDPVLKKPPRLYIDLKLARLSPLLKQPIPIEDGLLKRAMAGQYTPAIVRVVLDLKSVIHYKIFTLADPFRIVVDILGRPGKAKKRVPKPPSLQRPRSIRVVIDPGHGGEDPGAIGPKGLMEKDVVLSVAQKLRNKLRRELGWEVVMTRQDDHFIPLEERTAIANTKGGDLFLSIHANASKNRRLHGIETYFLNFTTDKDALRLAAAESGVSPERISDLQLILYDLMLNAKVNESSQLAECVQRDLTSKLKKKYGKVNDLGVKQAPFVVLFGAKMPSILIEISFISNLREERRLRSERYLDEVATAIFHGLRRYVQNTRMAKAQPSWSISTALSSN
ncbi:MAG: N-acetylmuramoyl-L-alanine amidase [Deltaproteobacteria bacterium]|nr:MAG: N-acetylmuramoyl-L-alanine amidase [Deltaproteobacteria bacterium]